MPLTGMKFVVSGNKNINSDIKIKYVTCKLSAYRRSHHLSFISIIPIALKLSNLNPYQPS
jgi:hypothetical protein